MTEISTSLHTDDLAYARIFRLIAAAKEEAGKRMLRHVENLTNLALVQLVLDWEGVDARSISDHHLEALINRKTRFVADSFTESLSIVRCEDA